MILHRHGTEVSYSNYISHDSTNCNAICTKYGYHAMIYNHHGYMNLTLRQERGRGRRGIKLGQYASLHNMANKLEINEMHQLVDTIQQHDDIRECNNM